MLFWGIERGWEEWPLEGRRKGGASLNYSSNLKHGENSTYP